MKNIRNFVLVLAALTVLTNASVWEGAAAAAARGDLPDTGFYAATNSFPRNTVVDITNLETGKSIRVIVSAGLDSPGLLAILSQDASKSIGLQPKSIGRISMKVPSDPVAFSRFTEGLATSGDPDYDPRAMIAADTPEGNNTKAQAPEDNLESRLSQALPTGKAAQRQDSAAPLPNLPQGQQGPASSSTPAAPVSVPVKPASSNYPYLSYTIVDIPNAYPSPSLSPDTKSRGAEADWDAYWNDPAESIQPGFAAAGEDSPESTLYPIWAQGGSVGVIDGPELPAASTDIGPLGWDPPPSITESEKPLSPTIAADRNIDSEVSGVDPSPRSSRPNNGNAITRNEAPVPVPGGAPLDLALLPAEKRPPEAYSDYIIPPEAFIGPIERRPSVPAQPQAVQTPQAAPAWISPDYMDESLFIGPIEKDKTPARPTETGHGPAARSSLPETPAPAQTLPSSMDESLFVVPIENGAKFSVPLIGELERGKYYLQLGAFSQAAAVEDALTRIDKTYPLAVQAAGSAGKPPYRLLVGPVNLGESGALLQRFKSNGYKDAFVKSN
ncbi:hypothetical protein AGMMS49587_14000 [Spirochaetia bacterium]|nr:hypothetical protein AGMMS49587_14000 [Spirochaetia bacterium]